MMAFVGCSTSTEFLGLGKAGNRKLNRKINREIASESPVSQSCHTIIEDIIYLKEQREVKEAEKRKKALDALKN